MSDRSTGAAVAYPDSKQTSRIQPFKLEATGYLLVICADDFPFSQSQVGSITAKQSLLSNIYTV